MKFKKIISVIGSAFLIGSTIGFAGAMAPFVENNVPDYAIVTGSSAAVSDSVGANSISDYLKTFYPVESNTTVTSSGNSSGDFSDSEGVEEEIVLGSSIIPIIRSTLLDNKIPSLLDGEFSWDDGEGFDDYDFHEEIIIEEDKARIQTTLDDYELENSVVLENDKALEYRFVFDDNLDLGKIGDDDASTLSLTILGKEYEILRLRENSITISLSEEKVVKTGDVLNIEGITITIGDIFDNTLEVEGYFIDKGHKKKIKGVEVYVENIAYHTAADLPSKAIVKIGKDIERVIDDGDEYIKDDESWIWTINEPGNSTGYIGVKYDLKNVGFDDDEDEENAIGIGESYVFPENYAAVTFEGITNTTYEDFELSFDERDLYVGDSSTKINNAKVMILEGENDDSITLIVNGKPVETDSIYLRKIDDHQNFELYFKDIDGDIDNDHEGRIQRVNSVLASNINLVVGDTNVKVFGDFGTQTLTLTTQGFSETIEISIGNDGTSFDRLGSEEENAQSGDIIVGDTSIGTREGDVLTHYGIIVNEPESNAESDIVLLSIPSEQIFADISVLGQGVEIVSEGTLEETPEIGTMVFTDTEVESFKDKNIILVGGSCVNKATAIVLGLTYPTCGSLFTANTNVQLNQYLIETFTSHLNSEKIAIVISGYEGQDTLRGVSDFIASEKDLSVVGTKIIA